MHKKFIPSFDEIFCVTCHVKNEFTYHFVLNSTSTMSKIENITKALVKIAFALGCIIFVCLQSYSCFQRFVEVPQGTSLSIEFIGKHDFPSITICSIPEYNFANDMPYNRTFLVSCGIKGSKK